MQWIMAKRNKAYSEYVEYVQNPLTGEKRTLKITKGYRSYSAEQFTMIRFTENDAWIKDLKPVLPLLLVLSQWIDQTTDFIPLSSDRREYLCRYFDFENPRSLTTLLTQAVRLNALIRVNGSHTTLMINPSFIYRGSTKDLAKKLMAYAKYTEAQSLNLTPNTNFENE